jgi:hypothetical protein
VPKGEIDGIIVIDGKGATTTQRSNKDVMGKEKQQHKEATNM